MLKFGQFTEYNISEILFFKNYAGTVAGRLVPDLFLFFKKAVYTVKWSAPQFQYSGRPPLRHTIKKTV